MMKKCKGCGAVLQSEDSKKEGFIHGDGELCERCFRIRHYNEYKKVMKKNEDFLPILKQIGETNDLVVLVLDLLNLPEHLEVIKEHIHRPILLVLTKRDILPRSIQDKYLLKYMDSYQIDTMDRVLVSGVKNTNLDELMEKIRRYQTSNKVYLVGFTNAGKSTLVNTLLRNYSDSTLEITTSMLTSTTLDMIEIPFDDSLTFIDTPGLLEEGNIVDVVSSGIIKKINIKKEIKPVTYQIKMPQTILIDDICHIEVEDVTNMTFYMSNRLSIKRVFKKLPLKFGEKREIVIEKANTDVVILGLGFIRVMKPCTLYIDISSEVKIYTRGSLIGK